MRSRLLAALVATTLATGLSSTRLASAEPLDSDVISDVAERVVDSVVNISTSRTIDFGPAGMDPFFTDPRSPFYLDPSERQARSLGSGVIVTAKGRILTNAHVVAEADEIVVTLADGTELDAKVVGTDPPSDVAVLQLEGDLPELQPLRLGDSAKLRLGEFVMAVGNPFGTGQAVTMGIVSAKGRASMGLIDYEDFIQTDAAINPGNSGGALVNLRGELVGINTAMVSRSGGYEGLGFAIPSNMAEPIMAALIKHGKVSRGYVGMMLAPLTRSWAADNEIAVRRGVVVKEVVRGSPAARAGIQPNDVVTAVDGIEINNLGVLRNYIATRGAGQTVELEIVRGDQRETIQIRTGELPDKATSRSRRSAPAPKTEPPAGTERAQPAPERRDLEPEQDLEPAPRIEPERRDLEPEQDAEPAPRAAPERGEPAPELEAEPERRPEPPPRRDPDEPEFAPPPQLPTDPYQ